MSVGPTTRRRQLPVETTGFVGREAELARLSALLEQARLITVTGPGGVGKSRLALRAAAAAAPGFADGVRLVELSAAARAGAPGAHGRERARHPRAGARFPAGRAARLPARPPASC